MSKTIFEISAIDIKRKTLYDYCRKRKISYFKSINNEFYYVKTINSHSYNDIWEYLNKRGIQHIIYVED